MRNECDVKPNLKCSKCSRRHFYRFENVLHEQLCGKSSKHRKMCNICKKQFRNIETLRDHLLKDHLIPNEEYDEFKCPLGFCKFLGHSENSLRTHLLLNHIKESLMEEILMDEKFSSDKEKDISEVTSWLDSDQEDPIELEKYRHSVKKHTKHMKALTREPNGHQKSHMFCDKCAFSTDCYMGFRKGFSTMLFE